MSHFQYTSPFEWMADDRLPKNTTSLSDITRDRFEIDINGPFPHFVTKDRAQLIPPRLLLNTKPPSLLQIFAELCDLYLKITIAPCHRDRITITSYAKNISRVKCRPVMTTGDCVTLSSFYTDSQRNLMLLHPKMAASADRIVIALNWRAHCQLWTFRLLAAHALRVQLHAYATAIPLIIVCISLGYTGQK